METPKQMTAGPVSQPRRQPQQGQSDKAPERRKAEAELAQTYSEQMQAMHFSDWASI